MQWKDRRERVRIRLKNERNIYSKHESKRIRTNRNWLTCEKWTSHKVLSTWTVSSRIVSPNDSKHRSWSRDDLNGKRRGLMLQYASCPKSAPSIFQVIYFTSLKSNLNSRSSKISSFNPFLRYSSTDFSTMHHEWSILVVVYFMSNVARPFSFVINTCFLKKKKKSHHTVKYGSHNIEISFNSNRYWYNAVDTKNKLLFSSSTQKKIYIILSKTTDTIIKFLNESRQKVERSLSTRRMKSMKERSSLCKYRYCKTWLIYKNHDIITISISHLSQKCSEYRKIRWLVSDSWISDELTEKSNNPQLILVCDKPNREQITSVGNSFPY